MQENDINKSHEEEMEIDLLELAMTLWKKRKKLAVWSACGAVFGLVVAFSIPKEYATSVKLAPEVADSKGGGGSLGALASMAGFSMSSSSGADAVYPQLYPDVVSSVPFTTSLFDVQVTTKDDGKNILKMRLWLLGGVRLWGFRSNFLEHCVAMMSLPRGRNLTIFSLL